MALETLAATAVGYLVAAIKKSKGGQQAAEELSTSVWEWMRPLFLKDEEPLNDLKQDPEDVDNQQEVQAKVKKDLKKHPERLKELELILEKLQLEGQAPATTIIQQTHSGSGDNVGGDKNIYGK